MCPEDRGDYFRGPRQCLNPSVLVLRNNATDLSDDSRAADYEMSDTLTPRRCSLCPEGLFTPQPTYPITTTVQTVTDFSVCMHVGVCVTPGSHYIVQKSLSVATHFHFPGCHCPGESKHNGQKPSVHKASLKGRLQHQSCPSSSSFLLFAPCSTSSLSPQLPALLSAVDDTDRGFQANTLTGAFY